MSPNVRKKTLKKISPRRRILHQVWKKPFPMGLLDNVARFVKGLFSQRKSTCQRNDLQRLVHSLSSLTYTLKGYRLRFRDIFWNIQPSKGSSIRARSWNQPIVLPIELFCGRTLSAKQTATFLACTEQDYQKKEQGSIPLGATGRHSF